MSPALARLILHTTHLVTFMILLGTGLLLFLPNLRAAVTGGYSLLIRETHQWGGVAFAALPTLVILRFGTRAALAPSADNTWRTRWQGVHVATTVAMGVVFTLTGVAIWWKRWLPESIVDLSRSLHDGLTYVAAAFLGIHLLELAIAALIARIRSVASPAARQSQA